MKKKYIPADIEILLISSCDAIAVSVEIPSEPEDGGEGGGGTVEGGTGSSGSGTGGTYNPNGWMGI